MAERRKPPVIEPEYLYGGKLSRFDKFMIDTPVWVVMSIMLAFTVIFTVTIVLVFHEPDYQYPVYGDDITVQCWSSGNLFSRIPTTLWSVSEDIQDELGYSETFALGENGVQRFLDVLVAQELIDREQADRTILFTDTCTKE